MLDEAEVKVGGFKIKGAWIVVALSILTPVGGGIWAVAEFMGRIDSLESVEIPDTTLIQEQISVMRSELDTVRSEVGGTGVRLDTRIAVIEEQMDSQDISQLQGRLAELATNLQTIMNQQQQLLDLRDRVESAERIVLENQRLSEDTLQAVQEFEEDVERFASEVDDLWEAFDAVSNPLR
jgi:chromosome segregation ATPase